MSNLKTIQDFVVLNVKCEPKSKVLRQLFIKEHKVKEDNELKPNGRTLLVINIPPFVDRICIEHLFRDCGKIVDIFFHSKPTSCTPNGNRYKYFDKNEEINGYKVCYVVFTHLSGVKKALKLSKSTEELTLRPNSGHLSGLKAMKQRYNDSIIESNDLQKEINEFMAKYDKRVEEDRLKAKQMDGIPDSEGWVKVNRQSKRKHLPNDYTNDQKIIERQNKRQKKSLNALKNFYSFQMKETKIDYLMALKNKFEDDKKRIQIMKSQRKFKPF